MKHPKKADLRLVDCPSTIDIRSILLDRKQARELVTKIYRDYPLNVVFSARAVTDMAAEDMDVQDIYNVFESVSGKISETGVLYSGGFRYRVETNNMVVAVVFTSFNDLTVVTAWRKKHTQ